jgi:hypothetical protein
MVDLLLGWKWVVGWDSQEATKKDLGS